MKIQGACYYEKSPIREILKPCFEAMGESKMPSKTIVKDNWTFKLVKSNQWQAFLDGKHFAFVSTSAVNRALGG